MNWRVEFTRTWVAASALLVLAGSSAASAEDQLDRCFVGNATHTNPISQFTQTYRSWLRLTLRPEENTFHFVEARAEYPKPEMERSPPSDRIFEVGPDGALSPMDPEVPVAGRLTDMEKGLAWEITYSYSTGGGQNIRTASPTEDGLSVHEVDTLVEGFVRVWIWDLQEEPIAKCSDEFSTRAGGANDPRAAEPAAPPQTQDVVEEVRAQVEKLRRDQLDYERAFGSLVEIEAPQPRPLDKLDGSAVPIPRDSPLWLLRFDPSDPVHGSFWVEVDGKDFVIHGAVRTEPGGPLVQFEATRTEAARPVTE